MRKLPLSCLFEAAMQTLCHVQKPKIFDSFALYQTFQQTCTYRFQTLSQTAHQKEAQDLTNVRTYTVQIVARVSRTRFDVARTLAFRHCMASRAAISELKLESQDLTNACNCMTTIAYYSIRILSAKLARKTASPQIPQTNPGRETPRRGCCKKSRAPHYTTDAAKMVPKKWRNIKRTRELGKNKGVENLHFKFYRWVSRISVSGSPQTKR